MKLNKQNSLIPLSTMLKLSKKSLLKLIYSAEIQKAGLELRKETLIDFLNYQLNFLDKMEFSAHDNEINLT